MKKSESYNSFKEIEKENSDFLKVVKKFISVNYGKRCEELGEGCVICQMYCIYDLLKTHLMNRP